MSSSKKILESELLSRYLAHFGEPLPPVLTSDAADWVKEDFIRQALRRVGASGERVVEDGRKGSCRGVACYTRTSAQRAAGVDNIRGVNHPSVALPRIAGVARYAPTEEGKTGKEETPSRPTSTTPPPTPLLNPGPRALSALTDERLDTAPEGVRDARRRLRGLIPEASRLHLELVVASRDPTAENNKEKAHKLKARRAKLVEKLCEVLDERDSLWAVIEDYLTKADG